MKKRHDETAPLVTLKEPTHGVTEWEFRLSAADSPTRKRTQRLIEVARKAKRPLFEVITEDLALNQDWYLAQRKSV